MSVFKTRAVAKSFTAGEVADGAGAHVHRSIGSPHLHNLDPFLLLDEFNVGLPGGFPDHPHRGFETVTYVLPTSKGGMQHEDFMENKGELRPGDLQWMTPGRGIMHAEMPTSTEPAHGLQLWINLPKERKMIKPRYQEISRETVPHAFNEDRSVEAIVFAGDVFGYKGPVETEAPVTYVHFLLQPGATLEYSIPSSHNVFVYGVSGTGNVAGTNVQAHEAIAMEKEGDGVLLTATQDDNLEVVIMTGEPLSEPVFQYGPFVMSSREDIQQTLRDFDLRTNGFEEAHGWRSEIAPRRRHR
jgi:redox-sensitive bicupin YhaK (pirin superfamily)